MLDARPLHPLFGAEIRGVDLRAALGEATFGAIRNAFERYSVLVFPDQPVNDEQQLAFSRRFGPLEATRAGAVGSGTPIAVLTNVGPDGALLPPSHAHMLHTRANQLWHSDSSFKRNPAMASLLSGREVPPEGGDTEFASLRAAYAALPETEQRRLDGLVAVHDFAYSRGQIDPDFLNDELRGSLPPVQQALVRRNPVTGEKALFLGSHASHIVGMPVKEGRGLLNDLLAFATRPEFVLRHRWRAGDLVMWDNRAVLHRGRPWPESRYPRTMVRTTVAGACSSLEERDRAVA